MFSLREDDPLDGGGREEQPFLSAVPASAAGIDGAAKKGETRGAGREVEEVDLLFVPERCDEKQKWLYARAFRRQEQQRQ